MKDQSGQVAYLQIMSKHLKLVNSTIVSDLKHRMSSEKINNYIYTKKNESGLGRKI
jgi:hypothetical protein